MIFVRFRGGLGNKLFQWAFARVLSKFSGALMASHSIPLFPITETCGYQVPISVKFTLPVASYLVDLEKWVEKARQANILVRGCPHNIRFYEPNREWLAKELVPQDGEYAEAGACDIVLHVRLGDYFNPTTIDRFGYPTNVFARLLKSLDYDRCLIVTDSPDSPVIAEIIENHKGKLVARNLAYDYRTLYHAARLVMSPSTFSWWAAWTGRATEIYQPYEFSFWRRDLQFALDLPGFHVKRFDADGKILGGFR
jgi:hypothetical protein